MSEERMIAKTYDPRQVEDRIYKEWMEKGYFRGEVDSSKSLLHSNSSSKYNWAASYGPCLGQYTARHSNTLEKDARIFNPLGSRN